MALSFYATRKIDGNKVCLQNGQQFVDLAEYDGTVNGHSTHAQDGYGHAVLQVPLQHGQQSVNTAKHECSVNGHSTLARNGYSHAAPQVPPHYDQQKFAEHDDNRNGHCAVVHNGNSHTAREVSTVAVMSSAEVSALQEQLRSEAHATENCDVAEDGSFEQQAKVLQLLRQSVSQQFVPTRALSTGVLPRSPSEDTGRQADADNGSHGLRFLSKDEVRKMREEMRQQCSRRQQGQQQKRHPTSGDCPLFLSVRMCQILKFALREQGADIVSTSNGAFNALQLDDALAQIVAALIFHHRFAPAMVLQELDISHTNSSSLHELYSNLLETIVRDHRATLPPIAELAAPADGRLPAVSPIGVGNSALRLMGPPANFHGDASTASKQGAVGTTRIWFGADDEAGAAWQKSKRRINMTDLPIYAKKSLIIETIQQNRVTLLQGETGSGKTTQVPQYVFEMLESKKDVRIVITQPRRIAAITVAKRVADEMGEVVGEGLVGYKIRGVSVVSPSCKILFCTTGVLLRRLAQEGQNNMFSSKTVTHLLVDEVHERSCETDFMLTFLKQVIHDRPQLRVVLMSATMDADCFLRFFEIPNLLKAPPLLVVSGRCYPTHQVFLESIHTTLGRGTPSEGMGYEELRRGSPQSLSENDGIDYELIFDVLNEIDSHDEGAWQFLEDKDGVNGDSLKDGAVLIFMPGAGEITQLIALIEERGAPQHWWVLPLHGALPAEEQQDAFRTVLPEGKTWKVIVCTNVAETSVTVPDVTVVIDSCRERRTGIDKFSNTPQLKEQWCALDSLKQRRGRAGRVRTGICLRLISEQKFNSLEQKTPPEMQRVPLENIYLQLCACGVNDQAAFLEKTPDPPEPMSVQFARAALLDLGALDTAADDGLTPLGRHLAALPCHPRLGKILILGCILGVPGPVMSICAAMSGRSPLRTTQDTQKRSAWQAERQKLLKELGHKSDHCVWAVLMHLWTSEGVVRRDLCNAYGLSYERMSAAWFERRHLCESLTQAGFLPADFAQHEKEEESAAPDWTAVRASISGGLFPNVVRVEKTAPKNLSASDAGDKNKWMRYSFLQRQLNEGIGFPKSCHMHPNSMCFGQDHYDCPLLAFYTIQQTTKLYVYDVTEVIPWALLFFGSHPVWNESTQTLEVGGWARFYCTHKEPIWSLVMAARSAIQKVLARKINDVAFDATASPELAACLATIQTWGLGFNQIRTEDSWPFLEEFRLEGEKSKLEEDA